MSSLSTDKLGNRVVSSRGSVTPPAPNQFYSRLQCWNFSTINGGQEPSRNMVVVQARQTTQPGGIGSLESILGLRKSLKIRALHRYLKKT
jgi:hypothetical protein